MISRNFVKKVKGTSLWKCRVFYTMSALPCPIWTAPLTFTPGSWALKKRWEEGPELVEVGMGVPGAHLALAQLQGYGCTLELMQYVRAAGSTQPIAPNHIGVGHISLGLVDFEPFVQGLREQNVPFAAPVTRVRVGQWVFIEDPDGIRIELMGRIKT